jgi:hypothetical protein
MYDTRFEEALSDTRLAPGNRGVVEARVAGTMFSQPELGVTRISYVGFSAREAACLVATTKACGLETEIERDAAGHIHITVADPAPPLEAVPLPGDALATSLPERARSWLRAWSQRLRPPLNGRTA